MAGARKRAILMVIISLVMSDDGIAGQSFSCSIGEPACLDYGAVVCKSSAKCVARDAIVFDSYTCDFKGFVCKSALDQTVDEYESLRRKFNDLVTTANELREAFGSIQLDLEAAKRDLDTKESERADIDRRLSSLKSCLINADTLEDAKACN